MQRIGLAVVLALSVVLAPLTDEAQQAAIRRVGIYSDAARTGPLAPEWLEAFRGGLREHGWVEGRNVAIDFRESRTLEERPEVVALLLRTKPEVIVTNPVGAFVIRPSASQPPVSGWSPVRDVPILFVGQSAPVEVGLVESLARPGGSMTGLSYMGVELNSKRLQMLKELIPTLSRVGVLVPSDHPMRDRMVSDVEATARALGVSLQLAEVPSTDPPEKIDAAFEALARRRTQAVLGLQGTNYYRERKRVCGEARASDVRGLLGRHTPEARQMLRRVLVGKIEMKPVMEGGRRGYRFSGKLSVERLLTGVALDTRAMVVAPTGSAHGTSYFFRGASPCRLAPSSFQRNPSRCSVLDCRR